jgi:hypothetical protein
VPRPPAKTGFSRQDKSFLAWCFVRRENENERPRLENLLNATRFKRRKVADETFDAEKIFLENRFMGFAMAKAPCWKR